jgi:DNA polymerase-3 subunit alpha
MYLIFDTETTGLPQNWNAPITDTQNWPRCIQIAWQLHDSFGNLIENQDYIIQPNGFTIPLNSENIHGISTDLALKKGVPLAEVLQKFNKAISKTTFIVGHNVKFDLNIMGCEFHRLEISSLLNELPVLDTCTEDSAILCNLEGGRGGKKKLPTLTELYSYLFNERFEEAHNATADVEATTRCFLELIRLEHFSSTELKQSADYLFEFQEQYPNTIQLIGLKHQNLKKESASLKNKNNVSELVTNNQQEKISLKSVAFSHLHNHTQFSILQSTTSVKELVQTAVKMRMPAVAMTDTANMMGVFYFVKEALSYNKTVKLFNEKLTEDETPKQLLTPIVGCEFNVCENHLDKNNKDNGYQIVFLAKNKKAYHNLAKMASIAYTQGFYYVPRIDKSVIEQYKEGLVVLSGNLYGEIPSKILNVGETQAEEALLWWKEQFGEDFYLELMRHQQADEDHVNEILQGFSKQHNIKLIATNNTYYINETDAETHDILLCVKDGEKASTPIGRGRGFRYGLSNNEYYFKSQEQMKQLFADIPEAILNIQEIVDKIEIYSLERDVLLPKFDIPIEFVASLDENTEKNKIEDAYLKHLTYKGAKLRYPILTNEIKERIDFELKTIEESGYPGYFLIVQDFIAEARKMNVAVGPGRGSAAGSAVAYCLKITNIDPIKYNLLFERFLNPDRVSLPDIDIDFDDEGRQKVIDYVIQKYGANQVAQIITYGTMAAKSAIRDTARVLDLPLPDTDRLAKLVPDVKLADIFGDSEKSKQKIKNLSAELGLKANELLNISEGDDLEAQTLNQAMKLEGTLRNIGTHACGIIITPEDITNLIPVAVSKDSDNMFVTQYDNNVVESAGLLKMDFLGLKTLTLIKDTVKIVKAIHKIDLDPDEFPLDDEKTYQLFQNGDTIGIFQYESAGMQKHLKALKPTEFGDLIAMNALYRPGPMEYIPQFVRRKHGDEPITYDLPEMEEYLQETYGITVYQEQVMLLSQKLAGFTRGQADELRKAMGKKLADLLQKLKPLFLKGGTERNHPTNILEKIWKDWEAFAQYAFNKSHSTCYAFIAFQTAYLKAHYPAEYMAAVLSNNMNDLKQVATFMEECKHLNIPVLGPDINESYYKFSVNKKGAIRFGMGAIKGVGEGAVDAIVEERKKNGNFSSVFDLSKRVETRAVNKKVYDGLVLAGAFDSFRGTHRAQYFLTDERGQTTIEKILRFGNKFQENQNSAQVSLFGEASEIQLPEPEIPNCEPWNTMVLLAKEKEVVGMYTSAHPLDDFKHEMRFANTTIALFKMPVESYLNQNISFGGMVTQVQHRVSREGKGWATFVIEDYDDQNEFRIFGEEYLKYSHFLKENQFLFIRISVQEGFRNKDGLRGNPRIKFVDVKLLHDVIENISEKITLFFDITTLNNKEIDELENVISNYKGNKNLYFTIEYPQEEINLNLPSRKYKVDINKELLKEFDNNKWLYRIN